MFSDKLIWGASKNIHRRATLVKKKHRETWCFLTTFQEMLLFLEENSILHATARKNDWHCLELFSGFFVLIKSRNRILTQGLIVFQPKKWGARRRTQPLYIIYYILYILSIIYYILYIIYYILYIIYNILYIIYHIIY